LRALSAKSSATRDAHARPTLTATTNTIADRLAQPEGAWRPFQPPAGWRWPLVPQVE